MSQLVMHYSRKSYKSNRPIEAWVRRQIRSRQACTGHFSVKPPAGMSIVSEID